MFQSFAIVTLFALYTAACRKSPDAVCSKVEKLRAKSDKELLRAKSDNKERDKKKHDACVKQLTEIKEISPEAYKCIAGCSEKDTEDAWDNCFPGCINGDEKLTAASEKRFAKMQEEQEDSC